jgi:hypothetical protein
MKMPIAAMATGREGEGICFKDVDGWLLATSAVHCRDDMQEVFPPPIFIPFGAHSFGFGHNIRPWLSGQLGEKRECPRDDAQRGERRCIGEAKGKKKMQWRREGFVVGQK